MGHSIREKDPGDSTHPVETRRVSPLPVPQGATPSPPDPYEEEGELTHGDTDILDSITKALLDALQERRTRNNLPPAMIPVARIPATQLQQRLVTGNEPSESTIQATLDFISLGHDTSGSANLADKMSTVSHTLECTLDQPSNAVPAQINSRSTGRSTPTADAEITRIRSDL